MSLPDEMLRIFVSSTLQECRTERSVAKAAIESLNFQPILFEEMGARPHPPRSVYQYGLENSHIFVGIYRDSYGWVAPDMDISGLEDEYRLATARGMQRLLYVSADLTRREARLVKLLDEVKVAGGVTVAAYAQPEDLRDQIRNDVTAIVSRTYLGQGSPEVLGVAGPNQILESLIPEASHRLHRSALECDVNRKLVEWNLAIVEGPLGCGKTVLLLQLCAEHGWIYVDASRRALKEVVAQCANTLRVRRNRPAMVFASLEHALVDLGTSWKEVDEVTLAIDGCEGVDNIYDVFTRYAAPNSGKRLVLGARGAGVPRTISARLLVPPLDRGEVRQFVSAHRSGVPSDAEVDELTARSGGNPLYLRLYAYGAAGTYETSLQEYELRAWQTLPPRTREALTYAALAETPLSLGALRELLGGDVPVEEALDVLAQGRHLLKVSGSYYELFHDHFRATIGDSVRANPARHAYYAARLGRWYYDHGDSPSAFTILDRANDPLARSYLREAAFAVVARGDVTRGEHILSRSIEIAREAKDLGFVVHAMLDLSSLRYDGGDTLGALKLAEEAASEARKASDTVWDLWARSKWLQLQLYATGDARWLDELKELPIESQRRGDMLNAARFRVELSAAYIRHSRYAEAADEARKALRTFEEAGEEYGTSIAKANLASALSAIPEERDAATALLNEIGGAIPELAARQRAMICNFYTRLRREAGDTDGAKRFAREAIRIAKQLGDKHLELINRINLGNAYRQEKATDSALSEYEQVEREASVAGYRLLEAAANTLIASVVKTRDPQLAIQRATYAIGLSRESADRDRLARAFEERAGTFQRTGRTSEAAEDYMAAAESMRNVPGEEDYFFSLLRMGLSLIAERKDLAQMAMLLSKAFGVWKEAPMAEEREAPGDQLFRLFPRVVESLPVGEVAPIAGLMFNTILTSTPSTVTRRLVARIAREWAESSTDIGQRLITLASLVAAVPSGVLRTLDLVELAERVARQTDGLYFKPYDDGAHHWTVRLDFATPVVMTIQQLDDRPEVGSICTILALLLKGLSSEVQEQVLGVPQLPRTEAALVIGLASEIAAHVDLADLAKVGLSLPMKEPCAVTRATDLAATEPPPTVVILRDNIGEDLSIGHGKGATIRAVVGMVLWELVHHLFKGAVEEEGLRPKVISFVRDTLL